MTNEIDTARSNQAVGWLVLALLLSAAVILGAPFVGEIRAAIRSTFPVRYSSVINGSVAALVALGLVVTVARMRKRWGRLLLLVISLGLATAYALAVSTGNADVDAVERFHFIEYGLVTFCFYQAWRVRDDPSVLILPALAALLVGTIDEWYQWFVPGRVGEVHDVLLNSASITCGLLASVGINPPDGPSLRLRRGSFSRIGLLAASVVLGLAGFLQSVHLGHTIADEEAGRFDSRYSSQELRRIAGERAEQWRSDPPKPQRLLAREDQYLSEALFHVQERNDGDARVAWRENRILEKYFTPVLNIRTGSTFVYRWPPEQRLEMSARSSNDRQPYVSEALPVPMFKWRKGPFWILVAAVTCAIVSPCLLLERQRGRRRGRRRGR